MNGNRRTGVAFAAGAGVAVALIAPLAVMGFDTKEDGDYGINALSMADGVDGWEVDPIHTVGQGYPADDPTYTPPGVLDGLGAYQLDDSSVRVLANHELNHNVGSAYDVNGQSGMLTGARVSYFDINVETRHIVGSGQAYDTIYDVNGGTPTDNTFLGRGAVDDPFGMPSNIQNEGLGRLCSAGLFEPEQFGGGRGLEDRIFFSGEEDGGIFNTVGGMGWALDVENDELWPLPWLGRGAWENVTVLDSGDPDTVAILLAVDSSPFDADGFPTDPGTSPEEDDEAAPLYLYIGEKDPDGNFVQRNGLEGGSLYVWVADNGATTPVDFNTSGKLKGEWVMVDNRPDTEQKSPNGSTGYDINGFPTQRNLWLQAEAEGAFGFSRPEDVATNPRDGREAVLASTGVDSFVGGVDTFGTMYTIKTDFKKLTADLTIIYDGDADPERSLRSPDNLDWADDGFIYVQEDEAEEDTVDGEPLFGAGAANPNEAGIVRMNQQGNQLSRIANVNRGVALDASLENPTLAFDGDFGAAGEWETSGILDVSTLFGEAPGSLCLCDVQAHGLEDQKDVHGDSRIADDDLVEGGQRACLER